jgi:hypothetical protein
MILPSRSGTRTALRCAHVIVHCGTTSSRVASALDVAEGRFDEQHPRVEREDRCVGRRDLADQRALRGVVLRLAGKPRLDLVASQCGRLE